MKHAIFAAAALVLLLSAACAPAVVTPDPAQIQASAVAAAGTIIAMTQAAIPTATDIPPTLEPSPTPFPLPTLDLSATLSAAPTVSPTSSTGDDCNHLFDFAASGGGHTPVKFINMTSGSVNMSVGIFQKNAFGQCGYFGFVVGKGASTTVSIPSTQLGPCWYGYGWVNGSKPSTSQGGPWCLRGTDKWTVEIGPDSMKLVPP